MSLLVWIPGPPVAWSRPTPAVRYRKDGTPFSVTFNPTRMANWKKSSAMLIRSEFRRAGHKQPWEGPVAINIKILHKRPKRLGTGPRDWHCKRPDEDNVQKLIFDAMEAAGVVKDDAQFCAGSFLDYYAGSDEEPGVLITTYQLEGDIQCSLF